MREHGLAKKDKDNDIDKDNDKNNPRDLCYLRHWLQFRQLRTWIHDNLCCLTIKSDTGQHSQFLRCLNPEIWHEKRSVIVTQRPCCLFLAAVSLLGLHTGFSLSGKTKFNVNDQNRQTILKSFKSVYPLCPTVIKYFQYVICCMYLVKSIDDGILKNISLAEF